MLVVFDATESIRSASSTESVIGFSTNVSTPDSRNVIANSVWVEVGVAIVTALTL
jgi:hypothetical protein